MAVTMVVSLRVGMAAGWAVRMRMFVSHDYLNQHILSQLIENDVERSQWIKFVRLILRITGLSDKFTV